MQERTPTETLAAARVRPVNLKIRGSTVHEMTPSSSQLMGPALTLWSWCTDVSAALSRPRSLALAAASASSEFKVASRMSGILLTTQSRCACSVEGCVM